MTHESGDPSDLQKAVDRAKRRLERERNARKQAEDLLEEKSRELYLKSQQALAARERLQMALWAGGDTMWALLSDGETFELTSWDEATATETSTQESLADLVNRIHPEEQESFALLMKLFKSDAVSTLDENIRVDVNGHWRWYRVRGKRVTEQETSENNIATGTLRDITRLKQSQHQFQLMATAFGRSHDAMAILDENQHIVEVNQAFKTLFEQTHLDLIGKALNSFLENVPPTESDSTRFESSYETAGNKKTLLEVTLNKFSSDVENQSYLICIFRDITERRKAQQALERLATIDSLTGLPNRLTFHKYLNQFIHRRQASESVALFFVDLDGFKQVNDELGHDSGDELLREIAQRFNSLTSGNIKVARWGGDEFLLLVIGELKTYDLQVLANKILKFVAIDLDIQGLNLSISASIGLAKLPENTKSPDELIRFADAAMYEAKAMGKNRWVTYIPEHSEKSASKITMVSAIRQAIDLEEFDFVLQPKFDSARQIIGAELLARWHSPQFGPISPMQFIPAIENNGLAKDFGNLVIEMGARYVHWLQRLGFDIPIAINLSAIQLMADGLVETLQEACAKHKITVDHLELEITESVLLQEGSDPMERLNQLDGLGFSIAMDDFGTGYSSLNYLRHMPFSIVKVDRAFVIDADEDPRAQNLLRGIVGMCQNLGMKVVAEGIETEAQFELLKSLNVEHYQGFLLSKPLNIDQFIDRITGDV